MDASIAVNSDFIFGLLIFVLEIDLRHGRPLERDKPVCFFASVLDDFCDGHEDYLSSSSGHAAIIWFSAS